MFHLQLPDILPVGDLAIRKAVASHFKIPVKGKNLPSPAEMEKLCEKWRPYRSIARWACFEAFQIGSEYGELTDLFAVGTCGGLATRSRCDFHSDRRVDGDRRFGVFSRAS